MPEPDQELRLPVVPVADLDVHNFKPDQKQPENDIDQETLVKIDVDTSFVVNSQEQIQSEDTYKEPVSSKPENIQHQPDQRGL